MDLEKLKSIAKADVKGKRVLVRADLNVPVKDGLVTDATRLERLLPGLQDLSARGARVVVISHFGRPKDGPDPGLSLAPVAKELGRLLGKPVRFVAECIGPGAESAVAALAPGEIAVLENLRFQRARRGTIPSLRASSRAAATSTSTTPSRRRTARTPRPRAWRICCPPMPDR